MLCSYVHESFCHDEIVNYYCKNKKSPAVEAAGKPPCPLDKTGLPASISFSRQFPGRRIRNPPGTDLELIFVRVFDQVGKPVDV
jgi:hypothetical protein